MRLIQNYEGFDIIYQYKATPSINDKITNACKTISDTGISSVSIHGNFGILITVSFDGKQFNVSKLNF